MELDGRPLKVLDGSLSEVARCVYGPTLEFLAHVHEGSGKPIYDNRSVYHPLIRPATREEVAFFEAHQAELAIEETEMGGLFDDLVDPRGCRSCTLIKVHDMPDDDEGYLVSLFTHPSATAWYG